MKTIRSLLKRMWILQEKNKQKRINPYNLLSYVFLFIIIIGVSIYSALKELYKGIMCIGDNFKWN